MTSKIIGEDNLDERITAYRSRMKGGDVPSIPLGEEGLYKIIGPTVNEFSRGESSLVQGRFIDVLADLVSSNNYFGWYCSDYQDSGNAYITKAKVSKIKSGRNLDSFLRK